MTENQTMSELPNLNRAIAIISHPFLKANDGMRDCFVRPKDAPKHAYAPLFDHHDGEPIGEVKLEYTRVCDLNDTHDLVIVTGLLSTQATLLANQGVSVGAPLIKTIGTNNIFNDVVEVSLVDVPHVSGCMIIDFTDYASIFKALYANAPAIVEQLQRELRDARW